MAISVFNTSSTSGTTGADIILAVGGGGNTITGDAGNDVIYGDHDETFVDGSNANDFNGSNFGNALNIDTSSSWSTREAPDVEDDSVPHTSVLGLSAGGIDLFSVTVGAGERITLDIDYGFGPFGGPSEDLALVLFDPSGANVDSDADGPNTIGGTGSFGDPARDPYLVFDTTVAGTYTIAVANNGGGVMMSGTTYLLNVSVTGHAAAPAGTRGNDVIEGGDGDDVIYGVDGDDDLRGDAGEDIIYGGSGNDFIRGGDDNDFIDGGDGDDTIDGQSGLGDTLDGGAGVDLVRYDQDASDLDIDLGTGIITVGGTAIAETAVNFENVDTGSGVNIVTGTDVSNTVNAGAGNDRLDGGKGDDVLNGEDGDDLLFGGAGGDVLNGGEGRDIASYADANAAVRVDLANVAINTGFAAGDTYGDIEVIIGTRFGDTLRGGAGADQLDGRKGNDSIDGRAGDDDLRGGDGDDVIIGGAGADRHVGGAGIDTASYTDTNSGMILDLLSNGLNTGIAAGDGYNGIENIIGSGGNDDIRGDAGANRLDARDGDDFMFGRAGDDTLVGGNGDDNLRGGSGGDLLNGGAGSDSANYIDSVGLRADLQNASANTGVAAGDSYISVENLFGSNGGDDLRGDAGGNRLIGRDGNDFLTGRDGDDELFGGGGDDVLRGGNGADTLTGNAGDDIFRFDSPTEGADMIRDFQINRDTIVLDDAGFAALSSGALSAANFRVGAAAADADDYIIKDGNDLYYDADGSGVGAQVLFATILNTTSIDENDFLIV